jgi:serine O-acetyltransferase
MAGAKVMGNSNIGDYVVFSANCYVKDQDIPSQSIVFGASPRLIIKRKDKQDILELMKSWFVIPD